MAAFDDAWYAEIIERSTCETTGDRTAAIDNHGRAVLAASCIIAEAINRLAAAISKRETDDR